MKIKPLDERVLVKPQPEEEKTAAGLIIPDTAKEKKYQGDVIAVGTDKELKELVSVGDVVLYGRYAGDEITVDGEDYILLRTVKIYWPLSSNGK
ncbi:MAG: co-chaperone GroES [Candidatus Marinimicrobia bacterium]|nr:co-chaperone GroES [Candidatus Neomarinimicrobiota bacterium]